MHALKTMNNLNGTVVESSMFNSQGLERVASKISDSSGSC